MGDIFQIVSLSRRSGTLQLTTEADSGEIIFRSGEVIAAYRTNERESVGECLLARGVVSPTTYQQMLGDLSGGEGLEVFRRFGVDLALVEQALEGQLKRLIYTMLGWDSGTFSFVLEEEPSIWRGFSLQETRAVVASGLSPQFLAMEGARIRDEMSKTDTLEVFLSRERPVDGPAPKDPETMQRLADQLRTEAQHDNLIPFPTQLVRREGSAVSEAPPSPTSEPAPLPSDTPVSPVGGGGAAFSLAQDVAQGKAADEEIQPVPTAAAVSTSGEAAPTPAGRVSEADGGQAVEVLLVVDDDPFVARHVAGAFEDAFSRVHAATSVKDAIALLAQEASVCVASDLIIARSDGDGILGGIEVLETVRAQRPEVAVVLFSDYKNVEAEKRAAPLGIQEILSKPRKGELGVKRADGSGPLSDFVQTLRQHLPRGRTTTDVGTTEALGDPSSPVVTPSLPEEQASQDPLTWSPPVPGIPTTVSAEGPVEDVGAPAAWEQDSGASSPDLGAIDAAAPMTQPLFDLARAVASDLEDFEGLDDSGLLPPPVPTDPRMAALRSMLAELVDPGNRDTVTLLVLRFATHVVERAALFLATRRAFLGLGGFSMDEASDQFVVRVRRIRIPSEAESIFTQVAQYRSMVRAPLRDTTGNRQLIQGLGGDWHQRPVFAVPLVSAGRVAAILYGDNPSGKELGPTDSLEIFMQQAGVTMDRALLERRLEEANRKRDKR